METIDFLLVTEGEMDFGYDASAYSPIFGTYGKIYKLDISAKRPYLIDYLQGCNVSDVLSVISTSNKTKEELMSYAEDENCPEVAFSFSGNELTVFLANDLYDIRFAFGGLEMPANITSINSLLNIVDRDIDLLADYVLKFLYESEKKEVPYNILERISVYESEVLNEL